ncbi:MAG: glutamate decarboxylase, partial [Ktedonobacteraceae bacterium]|nr:glutamate decarboxylase [Ktedonobacteraceae bacterium]
MLSRKVTAQEHLQNKDTDLTPTYGARLLNESVPRYELPEHEMLPRTAYTLIHDELILDGNSRLNLATFVT